ncbi:MAG: DUF4296 domain-containing protein [Prevotella sp.]|nr:DUF4296 domain-containing protein [Prevotella sp.]
MMIRSRHNTLIGIFLLCLLISCKPGVPRHVIQPADMEKLLYDYHVGQAMAQESSDDREYNQELYKLAVLKKHRVSEAEFDTSLVYYMRHTEQLHAIYKKLSERLNKEALALGASASEVNRYTLSNTGDTANIWTGEMVASLIPYAPYNKISFVIPADTAFRKGDRFLLGLSSRFLYQDGSRDAVMQLAVRFANDSVYARAIHMSSNTNYTVEVEDRDTLGIKELRGFILLTKDKNASETTLKLLLLDNIHLVRFHKAIQSPADPADGNPNDPRAPKNSTVPPGARQPGHALTQPNPRQLPHPNHPDKPLPVKEAEMTLEKAPTR